MKMELAQKEIERLTLANQLETEQARTETIRLETAKEENEAARLKVHLLGIQSPDRNESMDIDQNTFDFSSSSFPVNSRLPQQRPSNVNPLSDMPIRNFASNTSWNSSYSQGPQGPLDNSQQWHSSNSQNAVASGSHNVYNEHQAQRPNYGNFQQPPWNPSFPSSSTMSNGNGD